MSLYYSRYAAKIAPERCLDIIGDSSLGVRMEATHYNGIIYVLYMKRNGAILYGDDRVIVGAAQLTSCFTTQEWKDYHLAKNSGTTEKFLKNHPRWKVKSDLSIEALQKFDFGKDDNFYESDSTVYSGYKPFKKDTGAELLIY